LDTPFDLALDEISITFRRDREVDVHGFQNADAFAQGLQAPGIVPVIED
jgi:hypothetical protein